MYWNVPSAGGDAPFPPALPCPTALGSGKLFRVKNLPAQKTARSEHIAIHATSGIQCPHRQRATVGISTIQKSLPALRQGNITLTAGIAMRARGAAQNPLRVTFGSFGSEYLLPAPLRDIPNLSATTAARMGGPQRRPPRDTASVSGLPRRRSPARKTASRSGNAQPAAQRKAAESPRRDINSAHGSPQRRPPAWKRASKRANVRNAVQRNAEEAPKRTTVGTPERSSYSRRKSVRV